MDLSEEQWVDRFVLRVVMLHEPRGNLDELTAHGHALWPAHRESAPEAVADVEAGACSADIERRAIAQARRESTAPSASPPQNAR